MLKIADNLSLPKEAVSQTLAILGIRGSGKTNTGVVFAEELLKAEQQVVIIDPVDVWFGLKSSKNGKQPGYSIPVIGGEHADVPLDAAAGTVLADFVVDTRSSVILALRQLSMNDQRRFAADFAKRLYDRKGTPEYRTPLMLIVDEADEFVPQRLPHGHEAMFGAFDRLVRRGRSSGIGVTLISQRAQVINKDVLSQMETLVGMRVLHKLDRQALEAWIEAHDTEGRRQEFLDSLASLGRGDAWVWSPSWLGIFKRVHIRERETFDSSATPKAGEHIAPPKKIAPVDLEKLKTQMAATIEKAKAEDPRELQKQVIELKKRLVQAESAAFKQAVAAPLAPDALKREFERGAHSVKVALAKELRPYEKVSRDTVSFARKALDEAIERLTRAASVIDDGPKPGIPSLDAIIEQVKAEPARAPMAMAAGAARPQASPSPRPMRQAREVADGNGNLTGPEQRILDAIAWLETIGNESPEQPAVSFLAGYVYGAGGYNNPRGALRVKGLVDYLPGDRIRLTDEGRKLAQQPDVALTTQELHSRVLARLPGPEQRIPAPLLDAYPEGLTNEQCAKKANYEPDAGGYNNPRGRLRTLGLIEYPQPGMVRARDILFLEGK